MTEKKTRTPLLVITMATVAAMGGLLFGFDTGVVSGAIPFLQNYFGISDSTIEFITSAGLAGAIFGALFGGKVTERLGRKPVLLISGVIFAAGAAWSGLASGIASLVLARFFLGIAIGLSSFTVPLYIVEISPARNRGALVSLFQLMITIGILVAYFSDYGFAEETDFSSWRPMFLVGVIPAIVLIAGMFFMPESPRWLFSKGRDAEARAILSRTEGSNAEVMAASILGELEKDSQNYSRWKDLFTKTWKIPVITAIGIMFFQQFVGINTVIYYSPTIFQMAGFDGKVAAIGASIGVAAINVLATVVSVFIVDRLGRRKLFFIGMSGMVVSLCLLAASFLIDLGSAGKFVTVGFTLLYVTCFAVSVGPLVWLVVSEIFPQKLRSLGSSLGSITIWVSNFIVTFTFFKIARLLSIPGKEIVVGGETMANPAGSFLFYALIAALGIIWGYFYVPETKGVPLEKIEEHWRNGGTPRNLHTKE